MTSSNLCLQRQRQSKALGAAFLAHQVSQLEQSVDTLAFSRDSRLSSRGGGSRGGRGGKATRAGGSSASSGNQLDKQRQVRVIDASALVHALPVLKRWIREDKYKLVVPLSALSTLDVLKRAPEPLHGLARDATRFLEGQLGIANQIQSAFSPEHAEARIRLRAQTTAEEMPWPEVQKLFVVPPDWVVKLPEGVEWPPIEVEEGQERPPLPLPTAEDIPRHLRGALQCALYFATRTASPSAASPAEASPISASTVLFKSMIPTPAPLAAELARLVRASSPSLPNPSSASSSSRKPAGPPAPDFLAISSGDALAYYLDTFFPSISTPTYYSIPSTQVVAASAWLKQQAASRQQAGGDSARGGGGGGQAQGSSRGRGSQNQSTRGRGGARGRGRDRGVAESQGQSRTLFTPP
ncbi:hypothetical protein JCM10908_001596 [Rhodotorula pacifica]|uniref:uncharacterized protein n=1 Tax=Rhodotorula pacifica TaxID=1495444 RepID=UPI003181A8CB